jgi:16S rRNA (adenine(1408)-N(1))-methyltransferase
MAEASRRAARSARKGGLANAAFVVAAAEAPPADLAGLAGLVTVQLPWGSLLRGVIGRDDAVAAGLSGLVTERGVLELLLAPMERDGLDGVPTTRDGLVAGAVSAFGRHGFAIDFVCERSPREIRASGSTWAWRLDRGATLIRLRRR